MDVAGKVVLITGGGGGIGGGMAQAFAEQGARIILADINADHLQEEAARLPAGTDVLTLSLDVTLLESWAAARRAAEDRFGQVDVLCNNAGVQSGFKLLMDVAPDQFARLMSINVTGVYNGVATFARQMCDRGNGHIVNTSSMNGLVPYARFATYVASKYAVLGLSEALEQELGPFGVGVSVVFPGLTRSRMSESVAAAADADNPAQAAQMRANMMDPVWLGRAVVRAVRNNELYVITHPEHLAITKERFDRILAAFGEPAQPGYQARSG